MRAIRGLHGLRIVFRPVGLANSSDNILLYIYICILLDCLGTILALEPLECSGLGTSEICCNVNPRCIFAQHLPARNQPTPVSNWIKIMFNLRLYQSRSKLCLPLCVQLSLFLFHCVYFSLRVLFLSACQPSIQLVFGLHICHASAGAFRVSDSFGYTAGSYGGRFRGKGGNS